MKNAIGIITDTLIEQAREVGRLTLALQNTQAEHEKEMAALRAIRNMPVSGARAIELLRAGRYIEQNRIIPAIKAIRSALSCSLKDAKEMADATRDNSELQDITE